MKISIAIPFHLKGKEQNECYRRTFSHYASLPYTVHLCGSEGDLSRSFCEPFLSDTVKYFEVEQGEVCLSSNGSDVLREKFNDSLKTLPESDWYCLAGADDIVTSDFFRHLSMINNRRVVMAGVAMQNKLYLLDENKAWTAHSIELKYKVPLKLLAGINAFSQSAMKVCDFRPYQLKGCETGAEMYFEKRGQVVALDGCVVMLKGDGVLNPLDKALHVHKKVRINERELRMLREIIKQTDTKDE